ADFNGDGSLDLVVTNHARPGTVSVLLGNGDGTFQARQSYRAGDNPLSVAVGDFSGDGIADLAVANGLGGAGTVLLGNSDGTFQAAESYASGGSLPDSVAVGDFDRDGHLDLAVAGSGYVFDPGYVGVLLGKGDGSFAAARRYAVGSGFGTGNTQHSVAVGDFNGDGLLDLAVSTFGTPANNLNGSVSVLLG